MVEVPREVIPDSDGLFYRFFNLCPHDLVLISYMKHPHRDLDGDKK